MNVCFKNFFSAKLCETLQNFWSEPCHIGWNWNSWLLQFWTHPRVDLTLRVTGSVHGIFKVFTNSDLLLMYTRRALIGRSLSFQFAWFVLIHRQSVLVDICEYNAFKKIYITNLKNLEFHFLWTKHLLSKISY